MINTMNYQLKKPDYADGADIATLNDNADIIDTNLKRVDSLASAAIPASEKGVSVASLVNGKVPAEQLQVQGGSVYQATAPDNTSLLWLDATQGGAAKFHNGTAWVNVPAVWG